MTRTLIRKAKQFIAPHFRLGNLKRVPKKIRNALYRVNSFVLPSFFRVQDLKSLRIRSKSLIVKDPPLAALLGWVR
jgi:hypothetical protein